MLHHVTLPRIGAMKTIIDVLGPGQDEDPAASTTPPQSMKDINKVINGDADEFYIDNEYTNQQSPPSTPLRNAYNANNHNNNKPVTRIIGDDENLKEKIGEAEISAKKTIKYVLDITIAYADGKPLDLPNIVTGLRRSCQTHLLYRLYRCSEVCLRMSLAFQLPSTLPLSLSIPGSSRRRSPHQMALRPLRREGRAPRKLLQHRLVCLSIRGPANGPTPRPVALLPHPSLLHHLVILTLSNDHNAQ
jgi:hypothetical protein